MHQLMRFVLRGRSADARLPLVLTEAVRGIEGQMSSVDGLHARVGTLLSASTIATSFLGGIALAGPDGVGWPGGVAIALFIAHVVLALIVLFPRTWTFQTRPSVLLDEWIDKLGYDVDRMQRRLALRLSQYADENGSRLTWMTWLYAGSIGALALEIVMWLLEIGGIDRWIAVVPCPCA